MSDNSTPHPERIARLLAVAAATGTLPPDTVADAGRVIALVDAGASRRAVTAAVQQLISAAWTRGGRDTAASTTPRATRDAVERLRGVAALEQQLGLAPSGETPVTAPVVDPVIEPDPAPETECTWGAA
ncbi:hypothetical protein [Tsukamurella soli]|uniref:Uncharacterized protein n=1 Tax=Tsukamurella soli TaxID=644556 RepID=A0ABP8KB52_9ACTN